MSKREAFTRAVGLLNEDYLCWKLVTIFGYSVVGNLRPIGLSPEPSKSSPSDLVAAYIVPTLSQIYSLHALPALITNVKNVGRKSDTRSISLSIHLKQNDEVEKSFETRLKNES